MGCVNPGWIATERGEREGGISQACHASPRKMCTHRWTVLGPSVYIFTCTWQVHVPGGRSRASLNTVTPSTDLISSFKYPETVFYWPEKSKAGILPMAENRSRAHKTPSREYPQRFDHLLRIYYEHYARYIGISLALLRIWVMFRTTNLKLRKFQIDESVRNSQLSFDD